MTDKRYFALIGEDGYVYPVFFDSENEDKEIDVDTVVDLLNENENLKQQLQKIQNSFEVNWTQNYVEFNKDKLHIKDNNTEICLNGANLFIEVYIPQINEYYRFKYRVTGRSLMREFIENYNSNGDLV